MTADQVKELEQAGMPPQETLDLVYEEVTGSPKEA